MSLIFWLSLIVLYYVYDGYGRLLSLLAGFRNKRPVGDRGRDSAFDDLPDVTVLLTVHNEEAVIQQRIENILACDYPREKLDVLIASDGSTDATDDLVASFAARGVRLFRPDRRAGKSHAQNQAVPRARGEIIVFTDASVAFDRQFLMNVVKPFSGPNIGGVAAHLRFATEKDAGISESQGRYWDYELKLRRLEAQLGMLAVASGSCLTIRKALFRQLPLDVGEDCVVPLDVVSQGFKMSFAAEALVTDAMDREVEKEFRNRVRMTLRNLLGTLRYPALLNPLKNPLYAWSLWSHKLLRWFSPFFILAMTIAAPFLAGRSFIYLLAFIGILAFYAGAAAGYVSEKKGWRLPVAGGLFSFFLANAGFGVGVIKALLGERITTYR